MTGKANGGAGHVNLLKMCVGIDKVPELVESQKRRLKRHGEIWHRTRFVPRRADEVISGGSLYWVIKGFIRVRQRIVRIELLDPPENMKQCSLILDPELVRTELQARRAFQGWRYLEPKDAPADLPEGADAGEGLPEALASELRELGLL